MPFVNISVSLLDIWYMIWYDMIYDVWYYMIWCDIWYIIIGPCHIFIFQAGKFYYLTSQQGVARFLNGKVLKQVFPQMMMRAVVAQTSILQEDWRPGNSNKNNFVILWCSYSEQWAEQQKLLLYCLLLIKAWRLLQQKFRILIFKSEVRMGDLVWKAE